MENTGPSIHWGKFEDETKFCTWVAVNHGTNVRDSCLKILKEKLLLSQAADAEQILNEINQRTRMVDLAKTPMRTRFAQ